MASVAENNRRIAKNTAYLYLRMLLVMAVSLYTSRVILQALGANDFGLYSVVGGIVALFSIVSGSLSGAISRFITFGLGKGDTDHLKKIFANSLFIQVSLILIVLTLLVPLAIWFIANKMNINPDMYVAAYWVLGFSVVTFCINLLSVPYNAAIISHEKMSIFSVVSIIDVSLKLGISYLIMFCGSYRLIIYAALLLLSSLIVQSIYMIYCRCHFDECKTGLSSDKSLLKEIGSFAGWNFIGSASGILRNQGNNVLINMFFGTVVNAAYAVCMQVNNAVTQLSSNFMTSVNPQITKYYAQNKIQECVSLMFRSSRMSFFLTWILASVLLMNAEYILQLWLADVPEYTVTFVQLILLMSLIESVSVPLITGMLATGNIRNYQFVVGGFQMLNIPLSYTALKLGAPASAPLTIAAGISVLCLISRLIMLKKLIPFSVITFIKYVICRDLIVVITSMLVPFTIVFSIKPASNIIELIWQSSVCIICVFIAIYYLGCTIQERKYISKKIHLLKHRIIK